MPEPEPQPQHSPPTPTRTIDLREAHEIMPLDRSLLPGAEHRPLDLSRVGEVQLRIIVAGALIGFVSGLVGIGGGIMLSAILQRERILPSQRVGALSAGFILFNSVAALAEKVVAAVDQGIPGTQIAPEVIMLSSSILVAVVLAKGIIGSGIAIRGLTSGRLRLITGVLLVSVSLRVLV